MRWAKLELLLVLPVSWRVFLFLLREVRDETMYAVYFPRVTALLEDRWSFQVEIGDVPAISCCILFLKISPVLASYEDIFCLCKHYKHWLGNVFFKASFFNFDQDYNVNLLCLLTSLLVYFVMENQITNFLPSSSQVVNFSSLLQCYLVLHYAN